MLYDLYVIFLNTNYLRSDVLEDVVEVEHSHGQHVTPRPHHLFSQKVG